MSHIEIDRASFVPEALAGFCDLYQEYVQLVPGGVIRSTLTRPGKVAVVVGGGAGHYPAFAGYVGPGLADGAVVGNVFASPSARQVRDVVRGADHGGGVLLAFGNYVGDVLNFSLAAERLRAEGIATEIVAVSDDVASAPPDQRELRRGVAGDVVVFKVAGAAAERGDNLDEVAELARAANDATRSLGVAFSGCTVPGTPEPVFALPPGTMGVGLGVHGEPGISEEPICSARELALLLVRRVLAEAPAGAGERPVVLLNGLGATKYEVLFHLWHHIKRHLRDEGLEPAAAEAGELVTSLDMHGCSLTVAWLDDDGLALWCAPAQSPALRRGPQIETVPAPPPRIDPPRPLAPAGPGEGSPEQVAALASVLSAVVVAVERSVNELDRLDGFAGDGDHGQSMLAGVRAAQAAAAQAAAIGTDLRTALVVAADAWCDASGGTSGAIWSAGLRAAAESLETEPDEGSPTAAAARAALDAVTRLGSAKLGDKSVVDALTPFADALEDRGWAAAADAAASAAQATASLMPQVGRARPLADRSFGHPDPGATSLAICARAVADALGAEPA
ncbi:MAG: dihydroxyacetone kinase family protein [Solirubrobacteraceae bacterium]